MGEAYLNRIKALKLELLRFLGKDGRHYGDMTRMEQSVEDLAQALNTRLDQLKQTVTNGCDDPAATESPRERLASRFMETGTKLALGGKVDQEMADQFEQSLDLFDMASDLKRQSASARDMAESAAIKDKREKS